MNVLGLLKVYETKITDKIKWVLTISSVITCHSTFGAKTSKIFKNFLSLSVAQVLLVRWLC